VDSNEVVVVLALATAFLQVKKNTKLELHQIFIFVFRWTPTYT